MSRKIEIGGIYRHKINPNYGYAKVLELLPPRTGLNKSTATLAKVHWATDTKFTFALVKHFRISDLIKDTTHDK